LLKITEFTLSFAPYCSQRLLESEKRFKNSKGEVILRKLMKNKMELNPPPIPVTTKGSAPNMLALFDTFVRPVFLRRPVGVTEAKVKCSNTNCPVPGGSHFIKMGFSTVAMQVCGMKNYYTVLTAWLMCTHCHKMPQAASHMDKEEEQAQKQYMWHAYSPKIITSEMGCR